MLTPRVEPFQPYLRNEESWNGKKLPPPPYNLILQPFRSALEQTEHDRFDSIPQHQSPMQSSHDISFYQEVLGVGNFLLSDAQVQRSTSLGTPTQDPPSKGFYDPYTFIPTSNFQQQEQRSRHSSQFVNEQQLMIQRHRKAQEVANLEANSQYTHTILLGQHKLNPVPPRQKSQAQNNNYWGSRNYRRVKDKVDRPNNSCIAPKLNRAMTDIYADELYNPTFQITPALPVKGVNAVGLDRFDLFT